MIAANFYLPKLSHESIAKLRGFARRAFENSQAERFGTWLDSLLSNEEMRRESVAGDDPIDTELPSVDFNDWSNTDVVSGLKALTSGSYAIEDVAAGELIDQLVILFVAAACSRLRADE